MKNYRQRASGFSLIELCTALIILILLILIAFPTYRDTLLKTRRAEARAALYSAMLQQERFYTQHHTYNTPNSTWLFSANNYYKISASPCQEKPLNQCVLLTSSPNKEKILHLDDPVCGNLMLDSANNKTYSASAKPNALCW